MTEPVRRVSLVLGAGGARGYAHIGAIEELTARGYEIVAVAGASMGALVGGLHAAGRLQEFAEWAVGLSRGDVLRLVDVAVRAPGLARAERVMREIRGLIGDERIEDLAVPFTAVATDLIDHREVWFQRGPLDVASLRRHRPRRRSSPTSTSAWTSGCDGRPAAHRRRGRRPIQRRAQLGLRARARARRGQDRRGPATAAALRPRCHRAAAPARRRPGACRDGPASDHHASEAGARDIKLLPILRDELDQYKLARASTGPDDHVFTTATGQPRDRNNARQRVIQPVVERADELLAERKQQPLPIGVTAHKLRHTFASVLVMIGKDPAYVMSQLGHTDPAFTLRVYAHAMRRDEGDKERLEALVNGADWAPMGTGVEVESADAPAPPSPLNDESPGDAGPSEDGRGWFRTSDLSRVKRALSH